MSKVSFGDVAFFSVLALGAAAAINISVYYGEQTGVSTLPAQAVADLTRPEAESVTTFGLGNYGQAEPILRVVDKDNTCAGVVRKDATADAECPPESANLPTVPSEQVFLLKPPPID